jgi:hypothetical protein
MNFKLFQKEKGSREIRETQTKGYYPDPKMG